MDEDDDDDNDDDEIDNALVEKEKGSELGKETAI